MPHGIKYPPILTQRGHRGHFHAHVIESLGVLQSFAIQVTHGTTRTHTKDLSLHSTGRARGTEIRIATRHHRGCHSGRGRLSYGLFDLCFRDVAIGHLTTLDVSIDVVAGTGGDIGVDGSGGVVVVDGLLTRIDVVIGIGAGIDIGIGTSAGAGIDIVVVEGLFTRIDIAHGLITRVDVVVGINRCRCGGIGIDVGVDTGAVHGTGGSVDIGIGVVIGAVYCARGGAGIVGINQRAGIIGLGRHSRRQYERPAYYDFFHDASS